MRIIKLLLFGVVSYITFNWLKDNRERITRFAQCVTDNTNKPFSDRVPHCWAVSKHKLKEAPWMPGPNNADVTHTSV